MRFFCYFSFDFCFYFGVNAIGTLKKLEKRLSLESQSTQCSSSWRCVGKACLVLVFLVFLRFLALLKTLKQKRNIFVSFPQKEHIISLQQMFNKNQI